jgi:UDP-2,3-diacylglucosamine pyrophosphatase LpxH
MHGDEFDATMKCTPWLGFAGHHAYDGILWLNRCLNRLRGRAGLPYWSLAAYLKQKASTARKYIDCFEQAVSGEARRRGFDGCPRVR